MPRTKSTENGEGDRIVKLREANKTWAQISEQIGLPMGKCMFLYEVATVTPKTAIKGRNDEELKKNIAKAREDGLSWGVIAARSGQSEGYARAAYQEITGKEALGDRSPGKGGRFPSEDGRAPKSKKASAPTAKRAPKSVKKAAKAAPAKKTAKRKAIKKATKQTVSA